MQYNALASSLPLSVEAARLLSDAFKPVIVLPTQGNNTRPYAVCHMPHKSADSCSFFIRGHSYTMETISFAIRFWSKVQLLPPV